MSVQEAYRIGFRFGRLWWHEVRPEIEACPVDGLDRQAWRQARETLGAGAWQEAVTAGHAWETKRHGGR